jgi:hypothetical protein
MANKNGLIYKLFDMWKNNRLNNLAKKMLRDDPNLEKNLRAMDATFAKLNQDLKKRPDLTK